MVEKNQKKEAIQQWIRKLKLELFAVEDLLDGAATDHLLFPNSEDEPVLKAFRKLFSFERAADRSRTAREIKTKKQNKRFRACLKGFLKTLF